jgi:hypothetical protein
MARIPTTTIGGLEISRLTIGTNPFFGYSHVSPARDEFLRRHFTDERIEEVIEVCARAGMNAVVAPPNERLRPILDRVERTTGVHIAWFCTPGMSYPWPNWRDEIRMCADCGAEFIMPHTCYTDGAQHSGRCEIENYEAIAAFIREVGARPGLSTHRPETIVTADKAGYDVDVYIQPFNAQGFLCQVETDWVARVIREAKKPVIAIKPLGAGRILPPTGLHFVYNFLRPIDTVCIGMMSPEEAREDVAIVEQILAGAATDVDPAWTRSKAPLQK